LGDPSARFAFPEEDVVITNLSNNDTIQGLDLVEVRGHIEKDGVKDAAFNGKIYPTLFDRPGSLTISDGEPCSNKTYSYQRSVLYNGSAQVVNGDYSFKFFVSKDISFQTGKGRFTLYAKDTSRLIDAGGSKKDLMVGGLNPNPVPDFQGPQISLFMNDYSFIDYGLVGTDADLLVDLKDDISGINVTGLGLGHNLTGTLDGVEVYILNDYFENKEGSYTEGTVRFPLRGLSPGLHVIVVKGWDNSNNSAEAEIHFEVGINQLNSRIVKDVRLFPNPFTDNIYLSLENSYAGEDVDISLEIFDILGQRICEKIWNYNNSIARLGAFNELAWDARKTDGSKLPAGTYFCKIGLKSNTDGASFKINEKIILIR
jgi:hypothetical protein